MHTQTQASLPCPASLNLVSDHPSVVWWVWQARRHVVTCTHPVVLVGVASSHVVRCARVLLQAVCACQQPHGV